MQIITLITFVLFTGLVALITWGLTRRSDHESTAGYFLAGRSLGAVVIAGSLVMTNLSTEQLVGLNGQAFTDGFVVMAWEVVAAASLVLMALFFLPYYLRSGIATVPQFLEERFAPSTQSITTIIFIVAYAAILLPIILYTGALALVEMLNVGQITGIENDWANLWIMVWLIGLIGSVYAVFGGLKSVAISDTLNGIGLLIGGVLITALGLAAVGDGSVADGMHTLVAQHPDKFNSIGSPDSLVPFSTIFTGVLLLNVFYWCTNQQIIQRTFGARDLAQGQKGVLLTGAVKVCTPLILILPGIIAFHLYAGEGVEADRTYGMLVRDVLPAWLTGFFAAAVVGAILSSFNSALNSTVTLFSLGVYRGMMRPDAAEAAVVRSGKWCGVVVALAAMTLAPLLAGYASIFQYLQKMNGLYFIPILSVVIVGILARRVPAFAANLALILGCLVIAAGYFIPPIAAYVGSIHEYHFLGLVFLALVLMMLAIGAVRPQPQPWRPTHSGDVDMTPWRPARWVGLGLLLVVIALYALLAGGL